MDKILIFDLGGQYCHLIARRIRDLGVGAEIVPSDFSTAEVRKDYNVKGIILSGGARSVYEKNAPKFDSKILELEIPVLGICYGHQLIAHSLGGKVVVGKAGEYGLTRFKVLKSAGIFSGLGRREMVWMNHRDAVTKLPQGFISLGETESSGRHTPNAAFMSADRRISGVQFHPEVTHTKSGNKILRNFVIGICKAKHSDILKNVGMSSASPDIAAIVKETKQAIGNRRAIVGLSGGIDSSVAAMLVKKAIGEKLAAVFVDTGLVREGETKFVRRTFRNQVNLKIIDARKEFFQALKGVTAPEGKRKAIGKTFIDVFERIAKKEKAEVLVQGTIYSDRIESGLTKHSSVIKSHHNVGGLPKKLKLQIYEPLRDMYKDEVRAIGRALNFPSALLTQQVFPGPGLAIRVIGEVTPEKIEIVRKATRIVEEEMKKTKFWKRTYMAFAVLLPMRSTGVQGDARSYKCPIALRIVESKDVMTANFSKLPFALLEKIATRITNEIKEVNRVVYDITNKPPGTMEWE